MLRRISQKWPRAERGVVNAFIAALLLLLLLDGLPFVPLRIHSLVGPIVDRLGIWQTGWNMFAPTADTTNTRYFADIEYADGTVAHWNSPDWEHERGLPRFLNSRYLEYLDNAAQEASIDAWPALADHIARVHPGPHPQSAVRRVKIWAETARIEEPDLWGWQPRAKPYPYGKRFLLHEQEYP